MKNKQLYCGKCSDTSKTCSHVNWSLTPECGDCGQELDGDLCQNCVSTYLRQWSANGDA